ncbi:hypothetical protein [Streptacidiphilus anmyonensis]|uniref:hypothetical protein n=1 Tax=Streptacidiphilus anmyonensis TaxID=405782 RepID=UPI0005AA4CF1|nr:hypothetical protein [Streptacidiphilus anmyonensis]
MARLPTTFHARLGACAILLLAVPGAVGALGGFGTGAGALEAHAGAVRILAAAPASCSGLTDWNSIVTTGNPDCQLS